VQHFFYAGKIMEAITEDRDRLKTEKSLDPGSTILASSMVVLVSSSKLAGRSAN
jgi:hypothetical protein